MSPTSYQAAPPRVIDITRLAALLQLRVLLLLLCSSMAVVVDNATHGHGDHFFGASVLLDRFPKARFVAAPSAIQVMREQIYRSLWRSSGNRVSRISFRRVLWWLRSSGRMQSNWKAKSGRQACMFLNFD